MAGSPNQEPGRPGSQPGRVVDVHDSSPQQQPQRQQQAGGDAADPAGAAVEAAGTQGSEGGPPPPTPPTPPAGPSAGSDGTAAGPGDGGQDGGIAAAAAWAARRAGASDRPCFPQPFAYGEISESRFQHLRSPAKQPAPVPSLVITGADDAGLASARGQQPSSAPAFSKPESTPELTKRIAPILMPASPSGRAGHHSADPQHIKWDAKSGTNRHPGKSHEKAKAKKKSIVVDTPGFVINLLNTPSAVSGSGYSADFEAETDVDGFVTSGRDTDADETDGKAAKGESKKKKRRYLQKYQESLASASSLMIPKAFRSPARKAGPRTAAEDTPTTPGQAEAHGEAGEEPEDEEVTKTSRATHRRAVSEGSLHLGRDKLRKYGDSRPLSAVEAPVIRRAAAAAAAEPVVTLEKLATGMTDILTLGMSAAWRRRRRYSTGSVYTAGHRAQIDSPSDGSSDKDTDEGECETDFAEIELRRPLSGSALFSTHSLVDLKSLPAVRLEGRNPGAEEILTEDIANTLRESLPPRQRLEERWRLLYSLEQHGISLSTMYDKVAGKWALILAVKDTKENIFGAYLNEPLKAANPKHFGKYYGTGESFLWKAINVKKANVATGVRVFPWTGRNDYFMIAEQTFFGIGGGNGKFGLWLDQEFTRGHSATVPTYDNEPLAVSEVADGAPPAVCEDFECLALEVWGVPKDIAVLDE